MVRPRQARRRAASDLLIANQPRLSDFPTLSRLKAVVTEGSPGDVTMSSCRGGSPAPKHVSFSAAAKSQKGRLRLTFDPATDNRPIWTRDGEGVVFRSTRDREQSDIFRKRADGSGAAERLAASPVSQVPQSWSKDGRRLVLNQANPDTGWDIMLLTLERPGRPEPLLRQRYGEFRPAISPNGRWMAYTSNETGRPEVYVRPFPNVDEGRWQISREGGFSPVWGPNGRELFYRNGQAMILVTVATSPGSRQGGSRVLFTGSYLSGPGRKYDISPDGKRFLMIEADSPRDELIVVTNWFEELKRLLPTN